MPFESHELDAIKAAVSTALAQEAPQYGLDGPQVMRLGLPILAAIERAVEDPTDPRPFIAGRKVRVKGTGIQGVVVRTVETAGELHTVVVRLALDEGDVEPETPFGPRELEVLA